MTDDDTSDGEAHADVASVPGPDETELVGPGRYPLRIQPAAAIMPGEADARRLLRLWFVRKSFYWIFFSGWTVGSLVAASRHEQPEFDVQNSLTTAWFLVFLALALRFVANWIALGLAFPLALAHEPNLSPRTNVGSGIGKFFDRLHIARAFRSLRWTHHVRQVAQRRLGRRGEQLGKLDPIFDIVNIATGVLAFVALFYAVSRVST